MLFLLVMWLSFRTGRGPRADGPVFPHAVAQTSLSDKTPATKNTTPLYLVQKEADAREHLGIQMGES